MKKKFKSNSELCKVFAQQTQTHGQGNNMFFEYQTIYSYGHHYEIAQIVEAKTGEKIAFVNSNTYSNTTSKHTYHVLRALNIRYFFVPFTIAGNSFNRADYFKYSDLPTYLDKMKRKVNNLLFRQKNARKNTYYLQLAENEFNVINNIAILFDLSQITKDDFPLFEDAENKVKQMTRLTDEG
jgi:hypothetical protein